MKVVTLDFYGDNNLGLFGRACDDFCLVSNLLQEKNVKIIEDVLKVDVFKITLANTELVGLFSAFNSNGILLPRIANQREIDILKKIGINVEVLNTRFTAVGNLILCNDRGALISKIFTKSERAKIENCLGVESEYCTLAKLDIPGSCGIATNKGCLVHRDATEREIEVAKELLKVRINVGTMNFGSPFVGSSAIANSNGALAGLLTSGPEVANFIETMK